MPLDGLPFLLLLVVLGFSLLRFPWHTIEGTVQSDVSSALEQSGHTWAKVDVSGQHVLLSGHPPAATAGAEAIDVARDTRSETWVGPLVSPVRVTADFGGASKGRGGGAAWSFRLRDSTLHLTGMLSNDDARSATIAAAHKAVETWDAATGVQADLDVGKTDASGGEAVAGFGLSLLQRCLSGHVELDKGTVSLACEVRDARAEQALRDLAATSVPDVAIGSLNILVRTEADACDAALTALLKQPIGFASGRADLQQSSNGLLDDIAEAARTCPGSLRVEGHTDSLGSLELNVELSRSRAVAVKEALVQRGLPAERLMTAGLGPRHPVASNETPHGRASNRRIEIEVVRPNDP